MTVQVLLLLSAFAMCAAFIQRTTGFGFGIFIMTMLPYLLPSYAEATTLSGMLASLTSAVIVWRLRKHLIWKRLIPMLITFLVVSCLAILFLGKLSSTALQIFLGLMLIIAAIYFWFLADKVRINTNMPTQVSLGTLSGVMGGFFGMQGPPAVLYFLSVSETKDRYAVLAQTYFLIGNLTMTIIRFFNGYLTQQVFTSWLCAIPAVLLGTWIGAIVFKRLPMKLLRKIIYLYIGISGVIALCNAF